MRRERVRVASLDGRRWRTAVAALAVVAGCCVLVVPARASTAGRLPSEDFSAAPAPAPPDPSSPGDPPTDGTQPDPQGQPGDANNNPQPPANPDPAPPP